MAMSNFGRLVPNGRTRQLEKLRSAVADSQAGKSRVCLVTGRSGSGKSTIVTMLLEEIRASDDSLPTLSSSIAKTICAYELCHSGEAYGAFFNILSTIDTQLLERAKSGARTLRSTGRGVLTSLLFVLEIGPDAVGVYDPIIGLLTKSSAFPLKLLLGSVSGGKDKDLKGTFEESDQVYELVWRTLEAASEVAPLTIVVDDLQDADQGTQGLFFFIANRLRVRRDKRICLIGCYRVEKAGTENLGGLLLRYKSKQRDFEPIEIDLDDSVGGDAGRDFVQGLIDSIPNNLSRDFIRDLIERTQGHAQFTVDFLRFFLERGLLRFDKSRNLVEAEGIDFGFLPRSVEALIEERLSLLEDRLREVLKFASVEGVLFGAEVISHVKRLDALELFKTLDEELDTKHRFVRFERYEKAKGSRLHLYKFSMTLHQQYLYQSLGDNFRRELHRQFGGALEFLYEGDLSKIADRIAYHFGEAGDDEKAIMYLVMAGRAAERRCGFDDAAAYYRKANATIAKGSDDAFQNERYEVSVSLMKILSRKGQREEARVEMKKLRAIVGTKGDRKDAEVNLLTAENLISIGDYAAAKRAGRRGLRIAKELKDQDLSARAMLVLGEVNIYLAAGHDAALKYLRASLDYFETRGDEENIARNTHLLAFFHLKRSDLALAEHFAQKSLEMYQKLGDKIGENKVLRYLGDVSSGRGDYVDALRRYKKVYRIRRDIGQRFLEGGAIGDIGDVYLFLGFYDKSLTLHRKSLEINREVERKPGILWCHHDIGVIFRNLALNSESSEDVERNLKMSCFEVGKAVDLASELNDKELHAMSLNSLARSYIELGKVRQETLDFSKAIKLADNSIRISQRSTLLLHEIVGRSYKAIASMHLGDQKSALEQSRVCISLMDQSPQISDFQTEEVYYLHAQILSANGEIESGREFLQKALKVVMWKADRIKFERMRKSFLNNVPINREIIAMAAS